MPNKLSAIARGCRRLDEALAFIQPQLIPGISEIEVKRRLNRFLKKAGAAGFAFPTIVAFGNHTANIHHRPTSRRLTNNQIIMIDLGVKINGWCSDETRMFFTGKPKPVWLKTYRSVLKAQQAALSRLKGVIEIAAKDVDAQARQFFPIPHAVGHGLGKVIHDRPKINPKSKDTIKSGDIITLEPGRYFFGRFGVRIEDTVLKTKSGYRLLTKFPK
jgi:Xaa-Pro aminopeptidase